MIGGVWASRSPFIGTPISGVVVAGGKMVKPNQTPIFASTPLVTGRGVSSFKNIATNQNYPDQKRDSSLTNGRPSIGTTRTRAKSSTM